MLTMGNSRISFIIKQRFKEILQNLILPVAYNFWRIIYHKYEPDLIIFADAHNDNLPFSMRYIHNALEDRGYTLVDEIYNFSSMSQIKSALVSIRFMKLYAKAKCVFICDNFLPISSCKKSAKTSVIQLWHCCGLMKKMGYDTHEDIPHNYKGHVYRNYDLVTVSSPLCENPITNAMHLKPGIVKALGVSRTDVYFDTDWIQTCKNDFYGRFPDAKNKKIILWAPTFRGNAGSPYLVGADEVLHLQQQLGNEYYLICKVHPHLKDKYPLLDCELPTERLLAVTDLLISDYSTIIYDFLFFEKPYVLFAPDLEEYQHKRGFYVDYASLSPYIVTDAANLKNVILTALTSENSSWISEQKALQISSCDGKSTERILDTFNF